MNSFHFQSKMQSRHFPPYISSYFTSSIRLSTIQILNSYNYLQHLCIQFSPPNYTRPISQLSTLTCKLPLIPYARSKMCISHLPRHSCGHLASESEFVDEYCAYKALIHELLACETPNLEKRQERDTLLGALFNACTEVDMNWEIPVDGLCEECKRRGVIISST